jgi:hypothetical protein
VKVGDLVETSRPERRGQAGLIVEEVQRRIGAYELEGRLFKVLWNTAVPFSPVLYGPAWGHDLELISESR